MENSIKSMLEEFIEPDYGLLDILLRSQTLCKQEIQDIKSVPTKFARNRKLLGYIEDKDAVDELKSALAEENQMHLVNFIKSAGVYEEKFGDDWPLSNNETRILDFNQAILVDLIDPTELIDQLYSKRILNTRQQRILKSMNEVQQNEMLIESWGKTSRKNLFKIIECLDISRQSHIGDILKNGGAIFDIHVTMKGEENFVDISENQIVKTIKSLLKGKTQEEQVRIMELVQLGNDDVHLISVRKSNSIALYFHCRTLEGLVHLRHMVDEGRLKIIVETTFNGILRVTLTTLDEETLNEILKVNDDTGVFTIQWSNTNNYNKCKAYLQEGSSLTGRKDSSSKLIAANEQVYEMTKCCICTQTYDNPRSLPCLHTFCRKCLERFAEKKSPGERIGCPVCRQQWKIPVVGIDGFPRNNLVDKLVELGKNSINVSKEVLCDVCDDNSECADGVIPVAVKHCIECQQNMCEVCAYHHLKQKLSKHHELITLEGLEETERAKITSSTCDKHPRKPMVIYCLNCQTTICQFCFDESHVGHKADEVRNVAKRMQKELDGVADSMANLSADMRNVMTENPQTLFLNQVAATEIDIRDRSVKVMMIVEHHKERLLEYLGIVKSRIQKEHTTEVYDQEIHLGEIQSVVRLIEDLRVQGSISDITGVGPSLLARAQELHINHQVMCTKLKNQANWPSPELVPVDIDDLLSYNTGNLVGKIKVNTCKSDGDDNYYKFSGLNDYGYFDDSYADCTFIPPTGAFLSQRLVECDVAFDIDQGLYFTKNTYRSKEFDNISKSSSLDDDYDYVEDSSGPRLLAESNVIFDSGQPDSENFEEQYSESDRSPKECEVCEGYTSLYSAKNDSEEQPTPPVPPRVKSSPGSLLTSDDNATGTEGRLSNIIPKRSLLRSKSTNKVLGNSRGTEIRQSEIILERRLRRGKFTEIWLGQHNQVNDIAVKTFTNEAKKQSWIVRSCDFFQEAEVLNELQHENIVRLIGISSLEEPFYVITETTANGYLDHFLKQDRGTTLKVKDIINMAKQITSAMHYLELKLCIHRYLAAKSILVGENNSIKLTNFEMARILGKIRGQQTTFTDTYELLESPIKTRAPEVIESQRWSVKSDVWSFAIVLYEMLTYGGEPYPEMTNTDLFNCVLNSFKVPCPAGRNFTHPEKKLMRVMQCCWIKDPFKRPDFKYLFGFFKDYYTTMDAENLMGYLPSPNLIATIIGATSKGKGAVTGITMYADQIFLTRIDSMEIETYCGSTYRRGRCITVKERPKTILQKVFKRRSSEPGEKQHGLQNVTCNRKSYLYAGEWNGCRIYCVNPDSKEFTTSSWEVEVGKPSGLSATNDGNLLVSCRRECKICEYTFIGELLHEISFGCNSDGPRHALQIGSHLLAVCHGKTAASQECDGLSVIDLYGNIASGTKPMQLLNPSHLAVDSHQQILIAERARHRIIVATPILDRHRILLTFEHGFEAPTRLYLNEVKGLLLVGFPSGATKIYVVKSHRSIPDDAAKLEFASPVVHRRSMGPSDEDKYTAGDSYASHGDSYDEDDDIIYEEID